MQLRNDRCIKCITTWAPGYFRSPHVRISQLHVTLMVAERERLVVGLRMQLRNLQLWYWRQCDIHRRVRSCMLQWSKSSAHTLEKNIENTIFIFCNSLQNLRLGTIKWTSHIRSRQSPAVPAWRCRSSQCSDRCVPEKPCHAASSRSMAESQFTSLGHLTVELVFMKRLIDATMIACIARCDLQCCYKENIWSLESHCWFRIQWTICNVHHTAIAISR